MLSKLLNAKRDGLAVDAEGYRALANAIARDEISQAQLGALSMAIYNHGMPAEECALLTSAMAASGWQAAWSEYDLDGPLLDKHSTGGLGDIVSFVLAPMIAACGGYVPMISGRALEHTGGTVDKLETIPGYDPFPTPQRFQQVVGACGLAIVGQTPELVPADQRLYAIRDETSTVASLPLIAASILSKKKAEGLDALVLDLKVGSGAFMQTTAEAEPLGQYMQEVASACDIRCSVVYTDMNQPLANCIGDVLETREAVRFLTGERRTQRLFDVTMELGTRLIVDGGLADSENAAREKLTNALATGAAAQRFQKMVCELGGPADFLEAPDQHLLPGPVQRAVLARQAGTVSSIDGRMLGHATHAVGHREKTLGHDLRAGYSEIISIGHSVPRDGVLAQVYANTESEADFLVDKCRSAIVVQSSP